MGLIRVFQSLINRADDIELSGLRQERQLFERGVDIPAVGMPVNSDENCAFLR